MSSQQAVGSSIMALTRLDGGFLAAKVCVCAVWLFNGRARERPAWII